MKRRKISDQLGSQTDSKSSIKWKGKANTWTPTLPRGVTITYIYKSRQIGEPAQVYVFIFYFFLYPGPRSDLRLNSQILAESQVSLVEAKLKDKYKYWALTTPSTQSVNEPRTVFNKLWACRTLEKNKKKIKNKTWNETKLHSNVGEPKTMMKIMVMVMMAQIVEEMVTPLEQKPRNRALKKISKLKTLNK